MEAAYQSADLQIPNVRMSLLFKQSDTMRIVDRACMDLSENVLRPPVSTLYSNMEKAAAEAETSKWRQSTLRGSQQTFWRLKKAAKEHQRLESIHPSEMDKPNIAFDVFTYLERQEEPDQAGPELAAVARNQVYIRAEAGEEITKAVAMEVVADVKKQADAKASKAAQVKLETQIAKVPEPIRDETLAKFASDPDIKTVAKAEEKAKFVVCKDLDIVQQAQLASASKDREWPTSVFIVAAEVMSSPNTPEEHKAQLIVGKVDPVVHDDEGKPEEPPLVVVKHQENIQKKHSALNQLKLLMGPCRKVADSDGSGLYDGADLPDDLRMSALNLVREVRSHLGEIERVLDPLT